MLPDERMVEALDAALEEPHRSRTDAQISRDALTAAFAALDREALIEAGAKALMLTGIRTATRERTEIVLRAVGLIP